MRPSKHEFGRRSPPDANPQEANTLPRKGYLPQFREHLDPLETRGLWRHRDLYKGLLSPPVFGGASLKVIGSAFSPRKP